MYCLQHMVEAVSAVLVAYEIMAGWRHLTSAWSTLTHEVWFHLVATPIMDAWDDLVDFAICPWYHPLASLNQVLPPFARLFWELLGRSPIFWFISITFMLRWTYCDYYRYVAVGGGEKPSSIRGWLRTKYLSFVLRILRVNVLSYPFLDSTTDPYRGILFNLARRQGERPTILGLDPQRQGDQQVAPNTHAAMVAILEKTAAANPGTLVMGPSLVEKHVRALKKRLPAGLAHATPDTAAEWGGEVSYVHTSDGSAHVVLHPADCAEVIRKGWGERPPLACAAENPIWRFWYHIVCGERLPLPFNMVLVYAPRDWAEMDVFARIVDAAVWFAVPPDVGVDASTPGEMTPSRIPSLDGVAPSVNGVSPTLNGNSAALNWDAPAVDGDA